MKNSIQDDPDCENGFTTDTLHKHLDSPNINFIFFVSEQSVELYTSNYIFEIHLHNYLSFLYYFLCLFVCCCDQHFMQVVLFSPETAARLPITSLHIMSTSRVMQCEQHSDPITIKSSVVCVLFSLFFISLHLYSYCKS